MIQHYPAATEHSLDPDFLVPLLYLGNTMLDLFDQFLVFAGHVEIVYQLAHYRGKSDHDVVLLHPDYRKVVGVGLYRVVNQRLL